MMMNSTITKERRIIKEINLLLRKEFILILKNKNNYNLWSHHIRQQFNTDTDTFLNQNKPWDWSKKILRLITDEKTKKDLTLIDKYWQEVLTKIRQTI